MDSASLELDQAAAGATAGSPSGAASSSSSSAVAAAAAAAQGGGASGGSSHGIRPRGASSPPLPAVGSLQRTGSDPPPALSREELAQRRASSVEDAESIWARQIESSLLGSQRPSEHPSEGVLSRQGSAAAGSASLGSSGGGLLSVDELEAVLAAAADAADAAALELE